MIGPGKYDELCTQVREQAKAPAAMIIVIEGDKGSGFSCQLAEGYGIDLSYILRLVADQIERDLKKKKGS